jgi:predicted permease
MNWLQQIFRRSRLYSDLSEEMQEHLEEKTGELMTGGMSKEEAITAARREFGNALLLEERSRKVWRWPGVDTIFSEVKYAIRGLRRSLGFTLTVTSILALAIGVNTAVFSIVDALLLRPLPYPEPDRLAGIVTHVSAGNESGEHLAQDGETFDLMRDQVPSMAAAAYEHDSSGVNLQRSGNVRYVQEQRVSADYFDVLEVHPLVGRAFTHEEDRPHGPDVAILSYALWKSTFAQDPKILGNAIHLKGEPYIVVGVMPQSFVSTAPADLWTPLRPERSGEGEGTNYWIVARLKPGATWAQAYVEVGKLRPQRFQKHFEGSNTQAWLRPLFLQEDLAYRGRDTVLLLMCAVGFVLVIACSNLAGLFLVRALQQRREMATRMALGATRAAVLRQLLLEPCILAFLGGGIALLLAIGSMDTLSRILSADILVVGGLHLDVRILAFTAASALCATLSIALLPALELRRIELYSSMKSGEISPGQAERRRRRQMLIAAELALTVVLLGGAGLLIRTLVYLQTLPPGFDPHNVMTAQASLNDARYHDAQSFQKLLHESVAAMERIPGVESAAVGLTVPYEQALNNWIKIADGPDKDQGHITNEIYVTPEYFRALRIPLLEGRLISESDTPASQPVCVVSQRFAREVFGEAGALGRHLKAEETMYEVVGIVSDVAKPAGISDGGPMTSIEPVLYLPATQVSQDALNAYHVWFQTKWIVRTRGPISGLTGAMQKAFADVDPLLPFFGFREMSDFQNETLDHQRMAVFLLGILAALALLLSIIGMFGLVSNLVAERTREIGIRMALGSTLQRAMVEIGASGVWAAVWGIAAGLGLALFAVPLIRSELYGVRAYDPITFASVLGILLFAAVFASLAPTVRIARIDPASTLRAE